MVWVLPQSVFFSANRSKLCLTISSTVSLKVDGVSIFCFISLKEFTFGDDPVLGARLSLTFTKSHSLTGSFIPILLPSLSVICLLVLLITNTKKLCCRHNGVNS